MLRRKATLFDFSRHKTMWAQRLRSVLMSQSVGLIRAVFSAVGLFLGRKLKIFHEQNVKEFQFYIRMQNFRHIGSIIKKKYPKVADPLKPYLI